MMVATAIETCNDTHFTGGGAVVGVLHAFRNTRLLTDIEYLKFSRV
jgi:hypothetical protein